MRLTNDEASAILLTNTASTACLDESALAPMAGFQAWR